MTNPQIDTNNELTDSEYESLIHTLPAADETDLAYGDGISVKVSDLTQLMRSRDQQIALAAQIKELRRAKMQGYISADLVHKVDRRIATLKAQEKS